VSYQERLNQAESRVDEMRLSLSRDQTRLDMLKEQLADVEKLISDLEKTSDHTGEARVLFEQLTDKKRELVRGKIEALVTHGLQSVFGPSYRFLIEQKLSRNQVTFEYRIQHEFGGEWRESDLRGHHGGGLVSLTGFLLRVVMVLFTHPPRRRIIFLDETMAALDGDKRAPFADLLRSLGHQLNMQFVFITHSPEYTSDADKVYVVTPQSSGGAKLVPQ
jgi:DNA repair exonuclease SbcCD ATPase subunit